MKALVLSKLGDETFVHGWTSAADGIPCPEWLKPPWVDEYKNIIWKLLNDGSIVKRNIAPTAEQISIVQQAIKIDKATKQLLKIIVAANDNTATDAEFLKALVAGIRNALQ